MTRLVLFLAAILGLSFGFSWLADNPGTITVDWQGYHAEPTVFQVVVLTAVLTALGICAWTILRQIWTSPAAVSHFLTKRRQQRGLDALSSGMIAIGAGDRATATRYALQARKSLPNEPLTHLLRAQAAQLSGDRATSRRIFEAMLSAPDTEQLGLRGLYLEAAREGETEAQRQFAERAVALNPKLSWPVEGLFELQCKDSDWGRALETLNLARKHGAFEKPALDRRRAVLLAGQAMALEDSQADKALGLALEAHALAKDLVPAAVIAGRLLAARGNTSKAAKVLQKTWARAPHPDLATVYAYARIGDSPRDRLDRVKQLAALSPHSSEGAIAVANAAIEAHDFDQARDALSPLLEGRLTRRVATLMARIEKEQHGDKGRVRQWLARAVHAPRDPAWTADGVVSDSWAPASPVTGALDAFQWRVPVDEPDMATSVMGTSSSLDDLMALDQLIDSEPEAGGTASEVEAVDAVRARDAAKAAPASAASSPTGRDEQRGAERGIAQPDEIRERQGKPVRSGKTAAGAPARFSQSDDLRAAKAVTATSPRPSARLAEDAETIEGEPKDADAAMSQPHRARHGGSDRGEPMATAAETSPSGHHAEWPSGSTRTANLQRTAPGLSADPQTATIIIKQAATASSARSSAPQSVPKAANKSTASNPNGLIDQTAGILPRYAPDDPGPDTDIGDSVEKHRPWPYRLS